MVLVFTIFGSLYLFALFLAVPLLVQQLDGLIGRIPLLYAWLRDVALPWLQARTPVFELINQARPACCSLWFAARQPPATLPVQL